MRHFNTLLFVSLVSGCQATASRQGRGATGRERPRCHEEALTELSAAPGARAAERRSVGPLEWRAPRDLEPGQWATYRRAATDTLPAATLTFRVLDEADDGHSIEIVEEGDHPMRRLVQVDLNGREHAHEFIIYRALTQSDGGPVYEHPTRNVLDQHRQWTELLFPLAADWSTGQLSRVVTRAGRFDDALRAASGSSGAGGHVRLRYFVHRRVPFAGVVLIENGSRVPRFELLAFGAHARGDLEVPPPKLASDQEREPRGRP